MSLRLAIVADDLTGALDSAEPFARAGLRVVVATSVEALHALPEDLSDVVAVNTESRGLPPQDAELAVRQAWALLSPHDPACLFKKIDSRMKGNVVPEIAALAEASGRGAAIIAPAIPAMGRFVRDSAVTGFGVDAAIPIVARPGWEIPDCADLAAMTEIARRIWSRCSDTIAAGASGLAEALALEIAGARAPVSAPPRPASAGERRMIMAIGSRDPITLAQVAMLTETGLTGGWPIVLQPPPGQLDPVMVSAELAERALACARKQAVTTLLLSGGDTASAFIRLAEIKLLVPLGSLAPGMPVARGTGAGVTYTLITKSGGFGGPESLIAAYRAWSGYPEAE